MFRKKLNKLIVLFQYVCLPLIILCFSITSAHASALEEIRVKTSPEGYEINLNSLFSFQYLGHSPADIAKKFFIRLKTVNFKSLTQEEISLIQERIVPSWDKSTAIPLEKVSFEADNPELPQIILTFSQDVDIDVRSSADLKSIIVNVKASLPPPGESTQAPVQEVPIIENVSESGANKEEADLIQQATDTLMKGDNEKAIQFCIKALGTVKEPVRQKLQEFLGVAYERNGQLTHASSEYQKYLQYYPQGPDAERVRQRLAGVLTAAETPQAPLKEPVKEALEEPTVQPLGPGGIPQAKKVKPKWTFQHFGNLSQFFSWDTLKMHGAGTQKVRTDITTDLDFNAKWRSDNADVGFRMTGEYTNNRLRAASDTRRVSSLSLDTRDKQTGWYGRIGRQTLSSGGVLGRFDGVHISKQINSLVKLNGVFGFPVDDVRTTEIILRKKVYGLNVDWGRFLQKWDFNTFIIQQTNDDLLDRRAIGGQAQYADQHKAFFTLLDWDIYYKQLNIALFNGHLTLPTKTTLNLSADYRKSPILLTNNAMQGMGVDRLAQLKNNFTRKEIRQFALDRTTNSKTVTAGVAQDFSDILQWNFDATVSQQEGTITSGGIDGSKQLRPDYSYNTQLVRSSIFKEGDSLITGLGYTDSTTTNDFFLNLNFRYPVTSRWDVIPKFHIDCREDRKSDDFRLAMRPVLSMDFNFSRSLRLEFEGGTEKINQRSSGLRQDSLEEFYTAGFRYSF